MHSDEKLSWVGKKPHMTILAHVVPIFTHIPKHHANAPPETSFYGCPVCERRGEESLEGKSVGRLLAVSTWELLHSRTDYRISNGFSMVYFAIKARRRWQLAWWKLANSSEVMSQVLSLGNAISPCQQYNQVALWKRAHRTRV